MRKEYIIILIFILSKTIFPNFEIELRNLLEPDGHSLSYKLPKLSTDINIKFISEYNRDILFQSHFKTVFEREVNKNICWKNDSTYGRIEAIITFNETKRTNVGHFLTILSYSSSFCLNFFGIPISVKRNYIQSEFRILNNQNKIIKRYQFNTETSRPSGLYYGRESTINKIISLESFKKTIELLKSKLKEDSTEITNILRNENLKKTPQIPLRKKNNKTKVKTYDVW